MHATIAAAGYVLLMLATELYIAKDLDINFQLRNLDDYIQ